MTEADAMSASIRPPSDPSVSPPAELPAVEAAGSLGKDVWDSLRHSWAFWIGVVLIVFFLLISAFPSLFTSVDPTACNASNARQSPSSAAWFGFDVQGCDVYSRTVYGARASMVVGLLASIFALVIGAGIGVYGGFYGGLVDTLLSRLTDIFFGIPILLGSILVLIAIPTPSSSVFFSILKVSFAIAVLGWTATARVARSAVIQVKAADYVQAARALGGGRWWIIRKHVAPNAAAPVIVLTTLNLGGYITAEAALSYLGIGLQPPAVSWGIAISDASPYVRSTPHMLFFPSIFLSLMVLAFILLGDSVREALDPKRHTSAAAGIVGGECVLEETAPPGLVPAGTTSRTLDGPGGTRADHPGGTP